MSLTLRKKTLHQNFKVMSLQYVKKSNNYLSQPLKYRQDYRHTFQVVLSIMFFFIFDCTCYYETGNLFEGRSPKISIIR